MVAIFTGAGSGFERGSGNVLGSSGLLGSAAIGRSGEQVAFNAATGNLLIARQDEMLVGRGPDAVIGRTYNSLGNLTDDNGDNWRMSTDRRIFGLTGTANATGSTIKRRSGDGSEITYSWNGSAYVATDGAGVYDTLTYNSGTNVWTWTDGDTRWTETYAVSTLANEWRITAQADTSGNAEAFTYYSGTNNLYRVTTADGAYTQYNWSGSNITEVVTGYTDLATNTAKTLTRTRYGYDASNRLTMVTTDLTPGDNSVGDGAVFTTTYTYVGTTKLVASISQSDGSYLAIAYDGSNRVSTLTQTASTGVTRTTTIGYGTGSTTVTDATGQVTTLEYNADGSLKKVSAPPAVTGASAQVVQYGYNANGDLTTVTDALGKITTFGSFSNGLWETSTDPNGNVVTRTHDASGNLLTETRTGSDAASSAVQHTDRYLYDGSNRLIWTVSAQGWVTRYTYDGYGRLATKTQYPAYVYDVSALSPTTLVTSTQLTSWAAGLADKTSWAVEDYSYDARGGLTQVRTYAAADTSGNAAAATGYAQVATVYDQAGHMLSRKLAADNSEVFVYDGLGRLTASTDTNGATTSFVFVDSTADNSTKTIVTLANGYVQTSTFNKAGDLVSLVASGSYVTGGTTSFQYDALGRARVATDAVGNKSYTLYDKAGRRTADIDSYGYVTEYRYDADNRVAATVRWTNAISAANLTTLANPANTLEIASIRPAANAADIWSWSVYDNGGRLIESIAGDGSVRRFDYDGSDQLVKTTAFVNKLSAGQLSTIQATPPATLLLPTADAADAVARNFYSPSGKLWATLDAEGYMTRYGYDSAGRLAQKRTYTNATGASVRASGTMADLIASIPSPTDFAMTMSVYDGEGQLRYEIDELFHVTEYVYNDGVSTSSERGAARTVIRYAGSIAMPGALTLSALQSALSTAGLAGNANNRISYATYDAAGRLAYSIDATGAVTGYGYDSLGRLIKTTQFATTRATTSLPGNATMVSWAAANPNAKDRVTRSYYDARGEQTFAIDAEGYVTRNYYNALGQLTETRRFDTAVSATDAWTIDTVAANAGGTYASTTSTYDALGRVATVRDGENHGHDYSYYGNGTLAWDIEMAGAAEESRTNFAYDASGRLTDRIDGWVSGGANPSTHYTYNGRGDAVTVTDPNGHSTARTFDRLGQLLSETDAIGGVTSYQYDAFGNAVKVTDARGNSSYRYYDKLGRAVASRDAENYVAEIAYTVFGEMLSTTQHSVRTTSAVTIGGAAPSWTWDTSGGADAPATTSFEYDRLGRVTKSTDALGNYEQYTLDAFGNRTTVRNKLGAITTNLFDRRGLLTSESTAVSGDYGTGGGGVSSTTIVNTYAYDARGNMKQRVEGSGTSVARTTLFFYDKANRLIEQRGMAVAVGYAGASATPSTFFTYDGRGNLIKKVDPAGAATFAYYDRLDRKIAEIDALGTYSTFAYDAVGNLTATRLYATQVALPGTPGGNPPATPSGGYRETTYTYDNADRLRTSNVAGQLVGSWNGSSYVTATTTLTTTYDYDGNGNAIKTTGPDGSAVFAYYDKLGRKTSQIDAELYRTDWSYDANGNALSERRYSTRAVGTPTTAAPLSVGTTSDDRVTTFTYDKLGRRLTETRTGVVAWTLNTTNGLLSAAATSATVTYTYNALGKVASKAEATGDLTNYTYDNAGRLVVETRASLVDWTGATVRPTVRYYYNSLGDLTSTRQGREAFASDDRITTNSYGTGGRLESTTDANSNVRQYVYDIAGRVIGTRYQRDAGSAGLVQEGISTGYDALGRVVRQGVNTVSGTTWTEVSFTQTAYNAFGEVSQRGTNGLWQEQNSYDGVGRLIRSNAGDGVWRLFIYDAVGHVTMAIESEGMDLSTMSQATALGYAYSDTVNATITVYDKRGQATKTIQTQRELSVGGTRQNLTTEVGYNAFGEIAWEKDALLNQTDYGYNTMGRRIQVQHPTVTSVSETGVSTSLRPTERYYYDLSGRLVGSEDANSVAASAGRITTRRLLGGTGYGDSEGMVVKEWHLDGGAPTQGFDVFGDLIRQTDELGRITQMSYDKLSQVLTVARPVGLSDSYAYDILGQRTGHWNNVVGYSGREITEYDVMGRITRQVAYGGDITTTSYSWLGSLRATGFVRTDESATGGWQETTTYANGKTIVETADLFGHVTTHVDMGAHGSTFGYDRAGRVTSRTVGGVTTNYDYLNSGQLGQMSIGVDTSASQVAFTLDKTVYSYDKTGNRLTEQYSTTTGQWVEYGHTEYDYYYGYDQWVVDGYNYEVSTNVITASTATYDALNRLSSWSATATSATPAATTAYYYDANSNIRRSVATFRPLDQNGTAAPSAATQDYWYKFDLMNRVVTGKGILSGGAILRGTEGVDLMYNAAGERTRATSTTTAYGDVYVEVYDPGMYGGWGGYTYTYVSIAYDAEVREDYTYWADGQLKDVRIAQSGYTDNGDGTLTVTAPPATGARKANYWYDSQGRLERQIDWNTDPDYDTNALNVATYDRLLQYNAKGQVTFEEVFQRAGSTTRVTDTYNDYGSGTAYALGALVSSTTNSWYTGAPFTTSGVTNSYGWYDGAVIASTTMTGTSTGTTSYNYNAMGQLTTASIADGRSRTVYYTNDMNGQTIRRDEYDGIWNQGDPHEVWYRFAGREMGYTGNNGTLETNYATSVANRPISPGNGAFRGGSTWGAAYGDFDQFYNPITTYSQGASGGVYTVKGGETLAAIAAQFWGDSSLWYLIAEANGLSAGSVLASGQMLRIPPGVQRSAYNASTFTPYDPAAAMGDTSPTAPAPQTPAGKAKKNKCGVFGMILLAVVAIAVTAWVGPEAISFFQGAFSGLGAGAAAVAGAVVGGAVAGAAGSIASQVVGLATGIQDKFSWKSVGLAALGGAVGGALKGVDVFKGLGKLTTFANDVARGALSSAITQGIGVATGLQDKFSWAGVAAAGVGAGIGGAVGRTLHYDADLKGFDLDNSLKGAVTGMASDIADAATRSLIDGSDFGDNVLAGLPDVVAQFAYSLGKGAIDQRAIDRQADEVVATLPGGGTAEDRKRILDALAHGQSVDQVKRDVLSRDPNEIVVTGFRSRSLNFLPSRPRGSLTITPAVDIIYPNAFSVTGGRIDPSLFVGLTFDPSQFPELQPDLVGIKFVTDTQLGDDAHYMLTVTANGLGPPWFANLANAPDGTKFYQNGHSYVRGRPDLGNTASRFIWELKPAGQELAALSEVWDYSLSTKSFFSFDPPTYVPGKVAPSFFKGNKLTLPGAYGWIDYTFWQSGVITYRYQLMEEYVRVPSIFNLPLPIPGIVPGGAPIPVIP
ncbi:LysM peptidoglycan-binding domain-containing protein [Sphingomonas sp.]|uniref:LysM peptidoglycan-binding domain-containing protein n=1 Tax=Sphingomonas sp. TaxID=28214 RepID=UPI001B164BF0|nr:LysM peptidoglycan-binding domain-containing protein [Sphingomonas sp.]MBO9713324.1 LysM peptidoglycan-binding domain-containing protein [Sphingomonas sp.]